MTEEKIISRLLKIAELAKRGEKGERINAERKLHELMNKHNISWSDIKSSLEQKRTTYSFKFKTQQERDLLLQCFFRATLSEECTYNQRYKTVWLYLTPIEEREVKNLFNYYKKLYRKELKKMLRSFFLAFLSKHNIFGPSTGKEDSSKLSQEEIKSIMQIMSNLENSNYTSTERMLEE